MSDIFITYSNEDRERVQSLAHALESKGWSVCWDHSVSSDRSFDEVHEKVLDASKAVVVVWTKTSGNSALIKNEARWGLKRETLFPAIA